MEYVHPQEKVIKTFDYNGVDVDLISWSDTIWCGKIGYAVNPIEEPDVEEIARKASAIFPNHIPDRREKNWEVCISLNYLSRERPNGVMFGFLVETEEQPDCYDVIKISSGFYMKIQICDKTFRALDVEPWTGGIPPYEWIGEIIAPRYGYEYGDDTLPIYEYYLHNPENSSVEACYLYVPVREKPAEIPNGKKAENGCIREDAYLENYRVLMEINRKEIFGETLSEAERQEAVRTLLDGAACGEDVIRYKKRMRVNPDKDNIYPHHYIPPCHGNRKLRLIQGYLPKTHILYANHYELEILRLLSRLVPEDEKVGDMIKDTLQRLRDTCFGNFCPEGECTAAGISVLRFLAAVCPEDREWIDRLVAALGDRFLAFGNGQAGSRNGIPLSYLLMAFTDIDNEQTRYFLARRKEWLLGLLRRGWITGMLSNGKVSEGDTYNLMGKYILRNALGTLPEYGDIAGHAIYVKDEDGRCYCDI